MPAHAAFAGLNFIRAAFCPLEFRATRLGDHPAYQQIAAKDSALTKLEVGESLHFPRQFTFTDRNKHRRTGTQIVTAPFGLAPLDFDMFLGLYGYLRALEEVPKDLVVHLTADFIGKLCGFPRTCPADYNRIRSRVFRFSYVKYTNSAAWNSAQRAYESISNFEFFSIKSMSRLTQSCQPISLQLSPDFVRIIREAPAIAFDHALYRELSPALRRLYLIANRDGWNKRESTTYDADAFCIHQLGYLAHADERRDRLRKKDRLLKLRRLLKEAEDRDLVRPYQPWRGYIGKPHCGALRDRLGLRWSRGPRLRTKSDSGATDVRSLEHDALFNQVQHLRDEHGKPLSESLYRYLRKAYPHDALQRHAAIVLAQKDLYPGSFKKSEIATYIDRVKRDYTAPDWFRDLQTATRDITFDHIRASALTEKLYQSIAH